ncbi:MAG: histidine kinase [Christensenellaceae bacterium]|jgi:two-component system sensor histidine kinase YesM
MREEKASIKSYLKKSHMLIIIFMAIPAIALSILLSALTQRYNQLIGYIEQANEVVEIIEHNLERELWDIVAGNKAFEDGRQYEFLDTVDNILTDLVKVDAGESRQQYLKGALKMTETLRQYCDELHTQILRNERVSINEELLRETRRLTSSLESVVSQYVSAKIRDIGQINVSIMQATAINGTLLCVLVVLIVIFTYRSYKIAETAIEKPISQLEEISVKFADGDLTARSPDSSLEELEVLTESLNTMAYKLDTSIEQQVNDQKNLRKAELRTLQEQIKPHFLYNTLGAIAWQAQQQNHTYVINITNALTNFLRIGLSKGNDWIPVEQEVSHIQSYLQIQHYRYGDKIRYSIEVDPALRAYKMLKLLMQPLVENALYHGIKEKRGIGEILISGKDNMNGSMTFRVSDNGVGMTEELLEKVRKSIKKDEGLRDSTYGLYNVNQRIILYYGTDGLHIQSKHMQGTTVEFTVPCLKEGLDHV